MTEGGGGYALGGDVAGETPLGGKEGIRREPRGRRVKRGKTKEGRKGHRRGATRPPPGSHPGGHGKGIPGGSRGSTMPSMMEGETKTPPGLHPGGHPGGPGTRFPPRDAMDPFPAEVSSMAVSSPQDSIAPLRHPPVGATNRRSIAQRLLRLEGHPMIPREPTKPREWPFSGVRGGRSVRRLEEPRDRADDGVPREWMSPPTLPRDWDSSARRKFGGSGERREGRWPMHRNRRSGTVPIGGRSFAEGVFCLKT